MDACTIDTVAGLSRCICDAAQRVVRVSHAHAHDMTDEVLAIAQAHAQEGQSVLIVAPDELSLMSLQKGSTQGGDVNASDSSGTVALDGGDVCVTALSIDRVCLNILVQAPEALLDGHTARVLSANEVDVLVEDMKVTGLKPHRLREMLKFFYRSLAEFENEREDWLISGEEEMVYQALRTNLDARAAYLPREVPNAAYRVVEEQGSGYDVVVVLDYGGLDKGQQRLVNALARQQLVALGGSKSIGVASQDYPYKEGFEASALGNDVLDVAYTQEQAHAPVAQQVRCCATPSAEFADVAQQVHARLEGGADPSTIVVATPHKVWDTHIAAELARLDVPCTVLGLARKVAGDPRNPERMGQVRTMAALQLLADPTDAPALRTWVGLGDWLLRSDAFAEALVYCQQRSVALSQAMQDVRDAQGTQDTPFPLAHKFFEPLQQLDALLETCQGLRGAQLLETLAQAGMEIPAWLTHAADEKSNAAPEELLRAGLAAPVRADGAVVVCAYRIAAQLSCDVLYITGLVDGLLPSLDALSDGKTIDYRSRMLAHDSDLFEAMRTSARKHVGYSYFEKDLFENADALHMQTQRIFVDNNNRYVSLAPSQFIRSIVGKE